MDETLQIMNHGGDGRLQIQIYQFIIIIPVPLFFGSFQSPIAQLKIDIKLRNNK